MMKLGFLSSILQDVSFEQVIDIAAQQGFECVELACWPKGIAKRRYAGVTHLDVDSLNDAEVDYIKKYCKERKVEISSLAYYPNTLDEDESIRKEATEHLEKLILASARLGIHMVTTFIGRIPTKTVEENLSILAEVWSPIVKTAEQNNVKIAIENCPMLFGREQWPGGQNLFASPAIWRKIFEIMPSSSLGINYDPSHFIWQMIDYIQPIYEFKDRIFHVHIKDIKVYPDRLKDVGTMAYPLDYMQPKLPGLGEVDWGKYISALTDVGYKGAVCIEIEDKAFENSQADVLHSLMLSKRYIEQYII